MAFGFLVVAAAEGLCRVAGWGDMDPHIDPFVSFSAVEPLFRLNSDTQRHEIRRERQPYFVPDSFARAKAGRTFRVFCFGGSTVQGRPYSIETSFSTWLRLSLECAYPDESFEIVNCGGISYASYRLVPILTECLDHQPDLFILCAGQNEFLEDRAYAGVKRWGGALGHVARPLAKLHLYRSLARMTTGHSEAETSRPILRSEVDALLDYRRGLEAYHRDDDWRAGVVAHFSGNLRRMIRIANDNEVPMLVLAPPVNLKDCPPFKSEPSANLDATGKAERDQLLARANARRRSAPRDAAQLLSRAAAIDPGNAAIHFALGHCHVASGDPGRARAAFAEALEQDICPLRMLAAMRSDMRRICNATDTRFIDLQAFLEDQDNAAVMGTGILVDHIHPSIRGHQLIANKITETLSKWVLPAARDEQWQSGRAAAYRRHLNSLDDLYHARGRQRLENLQRWTEGRTDGLPIEMHMPIERR